MWCAQAHRYCEPGQGASEAEDVGRLDCRESMLILGLRTSVQQLKVLGGVLKGAVELFTRSL